MSLAVTVVIPTYKRTETLLGTLGALLANDFPANEFEVIVVDDAGDDQTRLAVLGLQTDHELRYLANPGRGAAAARNAGARVARGEVLLFLDDDMHVGRGHLRAHLNTRVEHPTALIGGTRWYSPAALTALEATAFGRYRISLERAYARDRGESEVGGVSVAPTLASYDLSMTRGAWAELGGFDESFPYAGAEDQDLCRRAVQAGLTLIRNDGIRLLHDDPATTLRQFSQREERGAHTAVAMLRKYPDLLGDFGRNNPIGRHDSFSTIAEKLAKELLSLPAVLAVLHRAADIATRSRMPDRILWRVYKVVVGLHTFLGYRDALGLKGPLRASDKDQPTAIAGSRDTGAGTEAASSLRVLLICQEFPGFGVSGGIGTYSEVVAKELACRDIEVHVLCVGTGQIRGTHRRDGYTIHTAPYRQVRGFGRPMGLPRTGLWVSQAYSVWREFRRLRLAVDVVEAPELYAEAAGIALLEPTAPLVVRLHSGFAVLAIPPADKGFDYEATLTVENFAVRRAHIVVSTAPHLAAVTDELKLDHRRTRPIIYPVPEQALAAPTDSQIVLFVGRLERRKGPELLIDAAPLVLKAIPGARFRFVGMDTDDPERGSYRSFLEARAEERGVRDAVEFLGRVPHDQVHIEMTAAGVCAFPSVWESFGLVVSDAGAIGRPVIVSDIPAFTDFVSDGATGLVVKNADGDAWAEAVIAALTDRESSRAMGERLRDYLQQRAAPGVVVDQVVESYRSAIRESQARRPRTLIATLLRRRDV